MVPSPRPQSRRYPHSFSGARLPSGPAAINRRTSLPLNTALAATVALYATSTDACTDSSSCSSVATRSSTYTSGWATATAHGSL